MNKAKTAKAHTLLDELVGLGVFRTAEAEELGISRWTVARMVESGELIRLEHGIYHHADAAVDPSVVDFAVACLRAGKDAAIGGLSALFYYVLMEQIPTQIWIMVPQLNRNKFPKYRVLRTQHDPKIGIDDHGCYRIVSIERSIVEAFAYQTKIGLATALAAGRTALREGKVSEKGIWDMAEQLKRVDVMRRNWEGLTIR